MQTLNTKTIIISATQNYNYEGELFTVITEDVSEIKEGVNLYEVESYIIDTKLTCEELDALYEKDKFDSVSDFLKEKEINYEPCPDFLDFDSLSESKIYWFDWGCGFLDNA